jgi:hypothetical protein
LEQCHDPHEQASRGFRNRPLVVQIGSAVGIVLIVGIAVDLKTVVGRFTLA